MQLQRLIEQAIANRREAFGEEWFRLEYLPAGDESRRWRAEIGNIPHNAGGFGMSPTAAVLRMIQADADRRKA